MHVLEVLSENIRIDEEIENFLREFLCSVNVEKGSLLRKAHTKDRNLYFIEKGLVRTFHTARLKDITHSFTKENGFVASKETLFLNQPAPNGIEALENTTLSYISFDDLQSFADTSISISRLMLHVMGLLAINTEKRIFALQYFTAKERYNQLMEESPDILLRAPLKMVASYLGISQETLSRIRSASNKNGSEISKPPL